MEALFLILNYILGFIFGRIIRMFITGLSPFVPPIDYDRPF